jgi:hypothetical protein
MAPKDEASRCLAAKGKTKGNEIKATNCSGQALEEEHEIS